MPARPDLAAVILAAGRSSRMGTFKPLLPFGPESIIERIILTVREAGVETIRVVVGAFVILFDPIFQGLAISLMAGEVASTLLSRMAVPVLYYPDPRKTLNRHDAKAAMDGMFGTFQSRTREPVLEAFRSSVCLPQ